MASGGRSQRNNTAEPFEVYFLFVFISTHRVFLKCSGVLFVWKNCTMHACAHTVQSFVVTSVLEASLHIYELINCRWADEVTQQLDNLQSQALSARQNSHTDSASVVGDR
ncbi:E3 ubiquitin-protein ligase TRIM37 [Fasciolopsis buskii]|uniref:E3 ubiquitin-protein ligase TRIM37 n=1 Tax=Fasciolopsis buskii TaxID=27845 RepID=A0A8E0VK20_9TREM|nr:E3 ubiquitin-protein ligase TRIM37 [Fasciolopsis buski]